MTDSAGPVLRDGAEPLLPFTERLSLPSRPAPSQDSLRPPSNVSKDDFLSLMTNWSGTGTKFDLDFHLLAPSRKAQLEKQKVLGRGAYEDVVKVTYGGVELAPKSIQKRGGIPKAQVDQLKESNIGEMLDGQRHIIKLAGAFWRERHHFNVLTYPVAVCDLGPFLDDPRVVWPTTEQRIENLSARV